MLQAGFLGTMAHPFVDGVRARLAMPCDLLPLDEKDAIARMPDLDILVSMVFTPAMAARAKRLRLVQVPGAGLDRIDQAVLPAGTALANVHGHEAGIAEYVLGAMLSLAREFGRLDAALRAGDWQSQWKVGAAAVPVWRELAGKTIGILGYGHIGQAIARRARAFDMQVCAIRRDVAASAGEELALLGGMDRLDEMLGRSEFLVVALPLVPATRGVIGARELALLPAGAMLVNVARGDVVDEDALYDALAARHLRGAALDVWYRYPTTAEPTLPSRRQFHMLPNVLMTPHVSGWTDGMLANRSALIAANIGRIAEGKAPFNLVPRTVSVA